MDVLTGDEKHSKGHKGNLIPLESGQVEGNKDDKESKGEDVRVAAPSPCSAQRRGREAALIPALW